MYYWDNIFTKLLYEKNCDGSGRGRMSATLISGLGKGYSKGRDQFLNEENTSEDGYGEGSGNYQKAGSTGGSVRMSVPEASWIPATGGELL